MAADKSFKAIVLAVSGAPVLLFLILYSHLQPSMTMQWGINGEANWHSPRPVFGAFLMIEMAAAVFVLTRGTSHGKTAVLAIFGLISLCGIGAVIANLQ